MSPLSPEAVVVPPRTHQSVVGADAGAAEPSGRQSAVLSGAQRPELLDGDHSILAFNERVFDWAVRADVPLLERLRYLCIVSSNLDEFFEVRAAPHHCSQKRRDQRPLHRSIV